MATSYCVVTYEFLLSPYKYILRSDALNTSSLLSLQIEIQTMDATKKGKRNLH
jgi:hypothetical protein